jgi:hypothetical protein
LVGARRGCACLDRRWPAALGGQSERAEIFTLRASDQQKSATYTAESPDHAASMTLSDNGRLPSLQLLVIEA